MSKSKPEPKIFLPRKPFSPGLLQRNLQALDGDGVLGAYVDVALSGADGIAGNGHGLQHGVGSPSRMERSMNARVAFVGVAHTYFWSAWLAAAKLHFRPVGESRAAAARRPEAFITSMTSCGVISFRTFAKAA